MASALSGCLSMQPATVLDYDRNNRPETSLADEKRAQDQIRDIEERSARGDLPRILFDFDKDTIIPTSYPTLNLIAQVILSNGHLKLMILAHTDNIGSADYNQDLSERRAKSVKAYLASQGVPPPYMRFRGFGFTRPIADNATEEGRAQNRRVEFRVTEREWPSVY